MAYSERGRALPAPVLVLLASKIRARVRDLGVESALALPLAKQDAVRRGRVLDLALSRIEHSFLAGEINELPERYFTMLRAWHLLENGLGWERVPLDVTPHREAGALEDLRRRFRTPALGPGQAQDPEILGPDPPRGRGEVPEELVGPPADLGAEPATRTGTSEPVPDREPGAEEDRGDGTSWPGEVPA